MHYRVKIAVALVGLAGAALLLSAGGAAGAEHCSFPYSTNDATGDEVTIEEEPDRVVTLAPSAAQTMWEIGAEEKVVGVSKYANYLEGAPEKENVSGPESIVVAEKVVALDPDLVIAPNVIQNDTVTQLRNAGITVYRFESARSIEDVYGKTRVIGRLVGACDGAEATVNSMRDRIATVERAVQGQEPPDVLYVFFGFTAGSETFIHEIIETAGGNNVAADANISTYREINPEVVVDRDPDWIVLNSDDPALPEGAPYNRTTAGRENRTVVIPIEQLNQPAPRIVDAITTLAKAFHPEAYAAANATPTATPSPTPTEAMTRATTATASPTEAATPTATATAMAASEQADVTMNETTDSPTETGTPGQAGFGVVLAAVALVAVLLAARSRR